MRTLSILQRNRRKLAAKLLGMLRPQNAVVVGRNAVDVAKGGPPEADCGGSPHTVPSAAAQRALAWIAHAQDTVGSGGVGSYDFSGWSRGYPEVTGYIIPTIWDYARATGREDLRRRAVRMADWELSIQQPCGGWEGGNEGDGLPPVVFNTGQVMRGLLRTFEETEDRRYLDAARRAGDWIAEVQDDDGSWTTSNHLGLKRVYDTYVAAPLARLGLIVGDASYGDAARRNCRFALSHQRDNGWFDLCDNSPDFVDAPITHAVCYTADGLIETGELLGEEPFVAAGARTVEALAARVDRSGRLPGRFDGDWRPTVRWVCLTGSAQLGIALLRLHRMQPDAGRLVVPGRLLAFLDHVQRLNAVGRDRTGAIAGSYPIWGPYAPFRFPCWATKYYLDLHLMVGRAAVAAQSVSGDASAPR